jgi:K+-transporting ATPase KdpF subunit
MSGIETIALVASLGLLVYLTAALLVPERFE